MSGRVLSTGAAREAITKTQSILNGPFLRQIQVIVQEGQTLSDPNVWDGALAQKFRSDWPGILQTLENTIETLEDLRKQVFDIEQDIMRAGGN